jgi:hypothetical protein
MEAAEAETEAEDVTECSSKKRLHIDRVWVGEEEVEVDETEEEEEESQFRSKWQSVRGQGNQSVCATLSSSGYDNVMCV